MRVLTVPDVASIINKHSISKTFLDLMAAMRQDFCRWDEFNKMPRPAFHVPGGVIELMPIADHDYFAFKYVNGHPQNPEINKQTVVATGQLSAVKDGYPILGSEMTVLTALRTAAASAIATDVLARKNSHTIAMIGTGAQSEFQIYAHTLVRAIKTVRYHDIDPKAMDKFAKNMQHLDLEFIRCQSNEEAVQGADIVIVCTACKNHVDVVYDAWIKSGVHINGLGGDCPGKTELEKPLLYRAKIVVEYLSQSLVEGEIQRFNQAEADKYVYAELWQILSGKKIGRENNEEITLFDSVGFALEDFSVLKFIYELANKYDVGCELEMVPNIQDPKNLFGVL
jgi:ornithine cyclodeaminase